MKTDKTALSACGVGVLVAVISAAAAGKEIFVAPDGKDTNPGTEAKPFATLGRAQQAARARARQEAVTVLFESGTYYLSAPIVFGPEDSGSAAAPVTYAARPGAKVVISAGQPLRLQWSPHKNGIWRADTTSLPTQIDQLFVDGKRRPVARWPNYREGDYGVDVGYSRGLTPQAGKPTSQMIPPLEEYAGFAFDPERFTPRTWAHPERAMLHVFQSHRWGNMQWRLTAVDYENHVIRLGQGGGQIGTLWHESRANWVKPNSNYYIENVYEELDAPGEWYHDAQQHVLYYMPAEGDNLARAEVVACGLRELVIFRGTAEQPVKHVHLRGLSFQHTGRTLMEPYETRLRGDWAIARRAAVRFDGAADCSVTDCEFTRLGGNGVLLSNYNRRVRVADSLFTDIGDSAVLVVGADDAVRELRVHRTHHVPLDQLTDLEPGPKSPNYPGDCSIHNNLMYRLGIFGKQVAGVYLSACERIQVSHNTICLVPRAAICINDGCWGGHTIEFNDAFLTVLETSDHGPINAWGRDRYWQSLHRENQPCDMSLSRKYALLDNYLPTVIRNNRFVDDGFSWGIDLDDGASNYVVTNNLCLGCSVKLREGYFRRVQNNIFVGPNPPNKHCCFVGSDDVYTNNIYVNTRDGWALNRGPATVVLPKEIDRNVYWNTAGKAAVFGYRGQKLDSDRRRRTPLSFAQWQELGADRNSMLADPLFVDADRQDFRLRPDSPALRLGFQEFPLDRFGTTKPEFLAIIDKQGLHKMARLTSVEATYVWMGAHIRSGRGGIVFTKVPRTSEAFHAGFRAEDLLKQMNQDALDNVDALIGAISAAPYGQTEFTVLRGKERTTIKTAGPGGVPAKQ